MNGAAMGRPVFVRELGGPEHVPQKLNDFCDRNLLQTNESQALSSERKGLGRPVFVCAVPIEE
jgi:hypothetical protein